MKHERVTEQIQEQAALYALGALSQHEAYAFESHLRDGCQVCEDQLLEFEGVVGDLSFSAAAVTPPSYLRDKLISCIAQEQPTIESKPAAKSPINTVPRKSYTYLPWAIAASIALLALLPLLAWRQMAEQSHTQQQELTRLQGELTQLQDRVTAQDKLVNRLEKINDAMSSPDAQIISLAGQATASSSSGKIYWNKQKSVWVVTTKLPPMPAGKIYQLWFLTANKKISAGLIKADPQGDGFAVIDVPRNIDDLIAAAITLEPSGGSSQPTSAAYVVGRIN
ncbi:MAG: anti-sigma factor [Acidobacteriota bacterium]